MVDVEHESNVGNDVEDGNWPAFETCDDVCVDVAVMELRVCESEGQVREVKEHKQQDDCASPFHRSARVIRCCPVS